MKKEQLIKELQKLPEGTEVVLLDYEKNIASDWGEGSSEGIYGEFEMQMHGEDEIVEGSLPFFAIGLPARDEEDVIHD